MNQEQAEQHCKASFIDVIAYLNERGGKPHRFEGPISGFHLGILHPIFTRNGLRVMASVEAKPDGFRWFHASFSRSNRLVSYADVLMVRRCFFAADALVLQGFPPTDEHVNNHENCLHLWSRLEGPRVVCDLRIREEWGEMGV